MTSKTLVAVMTAALTPLASPLAHAQRGSDDAPRERTRADCISTRRIDDTDVVDDRTILFYMRGGDIYQNDLGRSCPRLRAAGRFSYDATSGRLCDLDTITVFDPIDTLPGATCGLGAFRPITEEQADLLKEGPGAGEPGIEIDTIDLPVEEAPGSGGETNAAGPEGDSGGAPGGEAPAEPGPAESPR